MSFPNAIFVEIFFTICFVKTMFDDAETLNPSLLLRPYGKAERALGELAHVLRATPLHPTWLWRELTRVSVIIAQICGYRVQTNQLRMALIGAPVERHDNTSGLAAAKRVFLAAEPLFRTGSETDSRLALLPTFWDDVDVEHGQGGLDAPGDIDGAGEVARTQQEERKQLLDLVRELAGFADDGRRPALINLFVDLRKHAAARHLPPSLMRVALPLALAEAGLVPKAAPGLLGGLRLPLGMSRAVTSDPAADRMAQRRARGVG